MFRATKVGKDITTRKSISIAIDIAYDVVKTQFDKEGFASI